MPRAYDGDYTDSADLGWDEANALPDDFFGPDLPMPLYWRVLIMPVRPRTMSKGGIVLPASSQATQQHLNYIGKVVAVGSLAFTDKRLVAEKNIPLVGDYVAYGRYAGQVLSYKGVRLLIVNDDEILAVINNPDVLKVQI